MADNPKTTDGTSSDPEVVEMVPANDSWESKPSGSHIIEDGPDFDSDKPLIEQVLERNRVDRTDKTLNRGCLDKGLLIILSSIVSLVVFILLVWGLL